MSPSTADPQRNADNLKAASYYLGVDAVGLCAVPEWAYYSHDAGGNAMPAYHANGVNLLLDQGHETMEGASGDDWISVAQSMRAYLRFSMLGGIVAEQIRRLGYSARVHSVLDGDVLQPPLLLLSGLGEVSRIGEVILNPYLGPRLKSGTRHHRHADGLRQADRLRPAALLRELQQVRARMPVGRDHRRPEADVQRLRDLEERRREMRALPHHQRGRRHVRALHEDLPVEPGRPVRRERLSLAGDERCPAARRLWPRSTTSSTAARINPVKKWWWDIELDRTTGRYVRAAQTQPARPAEGPASCSYEDQTLAVYPADTMPPPYPVPFPVNREEGIERYRALLTPGAVPGAAGGAATPRAWCRRSRCPRASRRCSRCCCKRREEMAADVASYEFAALDGGELPPFDAGAHIDVVIAPEYQRAVQPGRRPGRPQQIRARRAARARQGGAAARR